MKTFYVIAFLVGLAVANIDDGNHAQSLQDLNIPNIPGLGDLPSNLTSKVPTTEDVDKVLREKCRKNGGEEAYTKMKQASQDAQTCVQNLVNVTELQTEMEAAKPTGDLDIVFRKYCRKSPLLKECIMDMATVAENCFDEAERASKKIIQNVTESLLNFVCFKEGDRIALFIAEGGPECLTDKQEDIKGCINKTMTKYIPAETPSLETLPALLFQTEQCDDFTALQTCIVTELEKCSEPTPANIVDSLFNFVRKVTPCSGHGKKAQPPTALPSSNSAVTNTLSLSFISFILIKYVIYQ